MIRSDTLPEGLLAKGQYRDKGCRYAPSCLNCPFPQCRYDNPLMNEKGEVSHYVEEVGLAMVRQGATPRKIVSAFEKAGRPVSPRTIERWRTAVLGPLCKGSRQPPVSIKVESGPGLFRCSVCDSELVKVKLTKWKKSGNHYYVLPHRRKS